MWYFVKTGVIDAAFSRIYGEAMDQRHAGDYGFTRLDESTANRSIEQAESFVEHIEQVLQDLGAVP